MFLYTAGHWDRIIGDEWENDGDKYVKGVTDILLWEYRGR